MAGTEEDHAALRDRLDEWDDDMTLFDFVHNRAASIDTPTRPQTPSSVISSTAVADPALSPAGAKRAAPEN